MKDQYVGDINDYRKYALLRVLASGGQNKIGVCWMLTPPDGRADGNKRGYLGEPAKHRHFDPELFDTLLAADAPEGSRRLQAIEESGAVPEAVYFNDPLPTGEGERDRFMARCGEALAECDLVFFDPDNGLEVKSVQRWSPDAKRYLYLRELAAYYTTGRSILIYQHFPRIERDAFIASTIERLHDIAPDSVVRPFRTPHVAFLLVLHPSAPPSLVAAADRAATGWQRREFIYEHKIAAE